MHIMSTGFEQESGYRRAGGKSQITIGDRKSEKRLEEKAMI